MKASGSYASLVRGVSQQFPQDRQPGQHTEQVNMIPDPVEGLTRRHGSTWVAEKVTGLDHTKLALATADTANWRTFEYANAGKQYALMVRRGTKTVGTDLPVMFVYNKTDKVFLTLVRPVTDAVLDLLEAGGASAVTAIGKYVFLAGNSIVPAATSTDVWGDAGNQAKSVVWIRGGAYARTFKVRATRTDNTVITFSYTTPAASYPNTLDTSTVPVYTHDTAGGTTTDTEGAYIVSVSGTPKAELSWWAWAPTGLTVKKGATVLTNTYPAAPTTSAQYSWNAGDRYVVFHSSNLGVLDVSLTYTHAKVITNPNYARTVSDLTNTYNSAVTNWIGTAAEAIQPQNIAESLKLAAVAAGLGTATRQDSTVIFDNVKSLVVQDGGDGSLIRGVANEIPSLDQVSAIHAVGKVVKVRATDSDEVFYLKAVAKDASITSGHTEVTWVEGAGVAHAVTTALIYGVASGTNFYLASTATLLNGIFPGTHPDYVTSTVGDTSSSPLPFFIGRKISYLGIFQDRLLVGAGAVLRASKIGDYLNFFRSSVLTAPADDPLEMLSQGSEDDELRHSVLYDRDLVIFGRDRQYAISGRSALTPTSANMAVMSSHEGAADVPPLASGGLIFYGKLGERASSLHQIQPGQVVESPESYIASSQVNTYLTGQAIELASMAKPSMLFMRTNAARSDLFVFTYLDSSEGRRQDAWHRWTYNPVLGPIIGMSPTPDGLLIYSLRIGLNAAASATNVWIVADLQPLTAGLSSKPYLDSHRPYSQVTGVDAARSVNAATVGDWHAAFDGGTAWRFIGDALLDAPALVTEYPGATGLTVGAMSSCYFTPTNPFVRDRNEKAITSGRLTVTNVLATFNDTSGFTAEVTANGATTSQVFNGRVLGDVNNLIGREPVTDGQLSIVVGRETREYSLTIRARQWFPMTLTSLEWTGQFFNRTQRL